MAYRTTMRTRREGEGGNGKTTSSPPTADYAQALNLRDMLAEALEGTGFDAAVFVETDAVDPEFEGTWVKVGVRDRSTLRVGSPPRYW